MDEKNVCIERKLPSGVEWDSDGRPRSEGDLDSIVVGTPAKAQVKIYFDSRRDSPDEVEKRIAWTVSCVKYLADSLEREGLR